MSRPQILRAFALAFGMAASLAGTAHAASVEAVVADAAGKPVADAVVYALPLSTRSEPRSTHSAAIEQVDREFVPYVSVVETGTTVSFPNRDPIMHHVYSFSPAKSFEIKLYTGQSPRSILFDKPGVITLGCNIHDWMIGYILVVATPHFAKTDASGVARLRDIPAGVYELHAWHPRERSSAPMQPVTLDNASSLRAAFVVDSVPRKPHFKPPLDRMKY
jgi:plastocyanin